MCTSSQRWHILSRVFALGCLLLILAALSPGQTFAASAQTQSALAAQATIGSQALNIVQQYQGVWNTPQAISHLVRQQMVP